MVHMILNGIGYLTGCGLTWYSCLYELIDLLKKKEKPF